MLPRRGSSFALLSCSVSPTDSQLSLAGYVSPVFASSCICCLVPRLLGYIASLWLPVCCSVVLFLPPLPVLLPRCFFSDCVAPLRLFGHYSVFVFGALRARLELEILPALFRVGLPGLFALPART